MTVGMLALTILLAAEVPATQVQQPSLLQKIDAAKKLLQRTPLPSRRIGGHDALLAVSHEDPAAKIKLITVRGGQSRTRGFKVALIQRNGVNTEYEVTSPPGYGVLAIKTNVRDSRRHSRPAVYVPTHVASTIDGGRDTGLRYLTELVERAAAQLEKREVYSMVIDDALVTETVPSRVILTLLIIEHITPTDIERDGISAVVDRVLATVAANQQDAYDYAVSRSRARGIAQFIKSTYRLTRQRYEKANLTADFVAGMSDHLNAATAMFCLADWTLTVLPEESAKTMLVPDGELEIGAFIAAAYNGGERRAGNAYSQNPGTWEISGNGLRPETVTYVQTFRAVYRELFANQETPDTQ